MNDLITSLAFSINSNKGVYAILLGSGISKAAGIPTGWEIILDLLRNIAKMHKIKYESEDDLIEWYKEKFNMIPTYSNLLEGLAKCSAERNQLLKSYFEPNDDDRLTRQKLPTESHRIIANFVLKGYIKVIITTNFDRLLENALNEVGVVPMIISTPDAIEGALPLVHAKCTIIKVNGDYTDIRIKNTVSELKKYDKRLVNLLDRVFDEFGLIVCGWSSDWDIALRNVIAGCRNRRFATYWASKGIPGDTAQKLIDLRGANVLVIESADKLFTELKDKIDALEDLKNNNQLNKLVTLSLFKKFITEEKYDIKLHDLVVSQTNYLYSQIYECELSLNYEKTKSEIKKLIRYYESITDTNISIFINGFYWGKARHHEILSKCLERIADIPETNEREFWLKIKYFPALLTLYAGGIAAIAKNDYNAFATLVYHTQIINDYLLPYGEPIITKVNNRDVLDNSYASSLLKPTMQKVSLSEYMQNFFILKFKEYLPLSIDFVMCFDRFEYLMSLVYADYYEKERHGIWGLIGCYALRNLQYPHLQIMRTLDMEAKMMGQNLPLLKAGLFDGKIYRFLDIKHQFDETLKNYL